MLTASSFPWVSIMAGAIVGGLCALGLALHTPHSQAHRPATGAPLPPTIDSQPLVLDASTTEAVAPTGNDAGTEHLQENQSLLPIPYLANQAAQHYAEQRCTMGEPDYCLALAQVLDSAQKDPPQNAARFALRAYAMLVPRCKQRDADACYRLHELTQNGRFIAQDDQNAAALLARTRELCRTRPGQICSKLTTNSDKSLSFP